MSASDTDGSDPDDDESEDDAGIADGTDDDGDGPPSRLVRARLCAWERTRERERTW